MPFPKSVKIAAIVSQSLIVLWVISSIIASVFQDKLLELFMEPYAIESTNKIGSWSVCVSCAAAVIASAANILICSRKSVHTPLVMTSVTIGLLPFAVNYAKTQQAMTVVYLEGAAAVARWSSVQQIELALGHVLYAALIITIAAGAVYAFVRKNCPETEELSQEGEAYDIANN